MTISSFISLAKESVPTLLEKNGTILYSHPDTIKKGNFYLMGLNPGGSHRLSIQERLDRHESEWKNEYTETVWTGTNPGDHPFQKNLIWLFDQLGIELNYVCASNLIFLRTHDADSLINYDDLAAQCWALHCKILNIVQPAVIFAIGVSAKSPIHYLYKISEKSPIEWKEIDSGHSNWKCKSFIGVYEGRKTVIIGLPHLSRYKVIGKTQVVKWISDLCSSHIQA